MLLLLFITTIIFNSTLSIPLLSIDLTHTFSPAMPYFPSQTPFNFTQRTAQWTNKDDPFFYAVNAFITSEHMGTHIDAPYHFSIAGWKLDEIPLKYLTSVHARVIDVSEQCGKNKNYLITAEDVKRESLIVPKLDEDTGEKFFFVLIFYTGWTKYWPNQIAYGGNEMNPEFPGLSESLARYLIDTYGDNLVGVGIDTLSSK